jgi:hypothetical protein
LKTWIEQNAWPKEFLLPILSWDIVYYLWGRSLHIWTEIGLTAFILELTPFSSPSFSGLGLTLELLRLLYLSLQTTDLGTCQSLYSYVPIPVNKSTSYFFLNVGV